MSGKLEMADGWRKTVLDWRMSVSQGVVGGYSGFFPLAVKSRRENLKIAPDKMAVEPFMGPHPQGPAYEAGLRGNQVITAVNGESPNVAGRGFLVWFIQRFDPGDRVTLTVTDGPDKAHHISYQLPQRGE